MNVKNWFKMETEDCWRSTPSKRLNWNQGEGERNLVRSTSEERHKRNGEISVYPIFCKFASCFYTSPFNSNSPIQQWLKDTKYTVRLPSRQSKTQKVREMSIPFFHASSPEIRKKDMEKEKKRRGKRGKKTHPHCPFLVEENKMADETARISAPSWLLLCIG